MPLYDFQCQDCDAVIEVFLKLHEYENGDLPACEACGSTNTKRVFTAGYGGVQCDSINDVSWLPSALKTLPDDAAKVESRTEWKRYLKENGMQCKG